MLITYEYSAKVGLKIVFLLVSIDQLNHSSYNKAPTISTSVSVDIIVEIFPALYLPNMTVNPDYVEIQ